MGGSFWQAGLKEKSGPRGGGTRAAGELLFGAEIVSDRKDSGYAIGGHEGELPIGVIEHYAVEGDVAVLHDDANGGLHTLKVLIERGGTKRRG